MTTSSKDPRLQRAGAGIGTPWSRSDRPVPRAIVQPLQEFLHTQTSAGVVLLVAALVALVWANSPARGSYEALWSSHIAIEGGGVHLDLNLREWVNDLLMAVFFFVVGLEIKREFVHGGLRDPRAAAVPVAAAVGGMAVPALLYLVFNAGTPAARGWGVPMATDIAFAVGVLTLAGRGAAPGLKVFLLTLAVVDDIGAIAVIAVAYSSGAKVSWLLLVALTIVVVVVLQRLKVRSLVPYSILAALLWLAFHESGVHATIAGVVLGLLTPARPFHQPERVAEVAVHELEKIHTFDPPSDDEGDERRLIEVARLAQESVSPLSRLEHRLHPWSAFVVLPLFALANAGVPLSDDTLAAATGSGVTIGVIVGLLLGKPVGVLLTTWLAVRTGLGRLPVGATWSQVAAVGLLAGIGFTVALFFTGLAFEQPELREAAKLGVLLASLVAGTLGALLLRLAVRRSDRVASRHSA